MSSFRFNTFFQNFLREARIVISLISHPDRTWISLRNSHLDYRKVYFFLIFPLCGLSGALTLASVMRYDGAVSAGISFLLETGLVLLAIYISTLIVFYLSRRLGETVAGAQIHASAVYIFVPWLIVGIVRGVLLGTLPILAGFVSYLLYLVSVGVGVYLLYFYSVYYLKIRRESRMLFFALACTAISIVALVLCWIEMELTFRLIVHGY